jgi:peptide/nickel transport system ATP-binding protein
MTDTTKEPLLVAQGLRRTFGRGEGAVRALDDVSFSINEGETLVLVGESGSGKTTAARVVLGLERPDAGSVRIGGRELVGLSSKAMRQVRRNVQVVLQDPMSQLNRRHTVEQIVATPLVAYGIGTKATRQATVRQLIESVGLQERHLSRRPHQLSGGQGQRVAIARALALNPRLVVLDESVSALDVSVRAQVLNLLRELQRSHNLSYLLITHDLAVARYMGQRQCVMFRGRIVESGETSALFSQPQHPYTLNLLESTSSGDVRRDRGLLERAPVQTLPAPTPGDQCQYLSRCTASNDAEKCRVEPPVLGGTSRNHFVACHFPLKESANV